MPYMQYCCTVRAAYNQNLALLVSHRFLKVDVVIIAFWGYLNVFWAVFIKIYSYKGVVSFLLFSFKHTFTS